MTNQEIRDKAPSGATHYHKMLGDIYYIQKFGFSYYWWDTHRHEWYEDPLVAESELIPLK